MHSDESAVNKQTEELNKLRIIMKYRLYGRDGVDEKEFQKLKDYIDPASGEKKEFVIRRRHDYDY